MSTDSRTIIALKSSFLRTQTRILSQDLRPSDQWFDGTSVAGNLPESIVRDVTREVNRRMKRHTKTSYSPLSIRQVAEQIDQLYWNFAAPDLEISDPAITEVEEDPDVLHIGDDLSLDENIAKLPPSWDVSSDLSPHENHVEDGESYISSLTHLHDLSAQRLTLAQKLSTYRTLLTLIKPYSNPQTNIQPNLVTRDAPLAADLNKTRTLAIRVAGRIGERYGGTPALVNQENAEESNTAMDDIHNESTKLQNVLSSW